MSGTMTDELALSTLNALRNWLPIHGAEIEAAQHALDHVTQQLARITALEESTHYANGCADLAMKHRDIAEAEAARLAQPAAAVPDMAEFYLALGRYEAEAYKHGMTGRNALAVRAACEAVQHLYAQARAASPPAQVAVPEGWQPIETAPKSVDDILALYGDDRYCTSVLIGRCDIPCESGLGVLSGCVAECTLSDDGRWVYPMDPEFAGCFPEKKYGEVVEPTHWAKMPDLPEPPK